MGLGSTLIAVTSRRCARLVTTLALVTALLAAIAPVSTDATAAGPTTTSIDIGKVRLVVAADAPKGAAEIAERVSPIIREVTDQFGTLFATQPTAPIILSFVASPDAATLSGLRSITPAATDAWASPTGGRVVLTTAPFLARTPTEMENLLRNAFGRAYAQTAARGHVPAGLLDGIARYLETPVLARQARLGAQVQAAYQAGTLPQWSALLAGEPPPADAATFEANEAANYAVVSFLIDRYGVGAFQRFVHELARAADWPVAMRTVFAEPAATIEARWAEDLPRWFETGWQTSVVAAFDLAPAEGLLDRGAYEAARGSLQRSQQLFTELGDSGRLARVEALIAQTDVGIQVDGLMGEAQAALTAHDYPRALQLLDQAERLAVALPEAHRPTAQIATYRELSGRGNTATAKLAEAEEMATNWARTIGARELAVEAGTAFSSLGDAERVAQAQTLVDVLDVRQDRLLLALAGLGLLALVWLGFWLWSRAPERLRWA